MRRPFHGRGLTRRYHGGLRRPDHGRGLRRRRYHGWDPAVICLHNLFNIRLQHLHARLSAANFFFCQVQILLHHLHRLLEPQQDHLNVLLHVLDLRLHVIELIAQ